MENICLTPRGALRNIYSFFFITFFDGTKMMMKKLKNMKNCLLLLSVFKIIVKCGEEQIKNFFQRENFQFDVFKVQRENGGV